jgi:hypothetical protein
MPNKEAVVYSRIEKELQVHLRTTLALHCSQCKTNEDYNAKTDGNKSLCKHALNHEFLSSQPGYERAGKMPWSTLVQQKPTARSKGGTFHKTSDTWTTVDHMMMEDGFSNCGSHSMHHHAQTQVRHACDKWNRHFGGKGEISESTTANSSVGSMHAKFEQQNLFSRWTKMINRESPGRNESGYLDPFQWCSLGLMYRDKTKAEKTAGKKRKGSATRDMDAETEFAEGFLNEDTEATDSKHVPYEYVEVFGSLMSLMVGVKAWAQRKTSGKVQVCADNMYNPIKGVPSMYWFNTGIMDAKGLHFPIVNALTLGRARPRNKVIQNNNLCPTLI